MENNRLKINIFILLGLISGFYEFSYGSLSSTEINNIRSFAQASTNNSYINIANQSYTPFTQFFLWALQATSPNPNNPNDLPEVGKIDLLELNLLPILNAQLAQSSVILAFAYDNNNLVLTAYNANTGAFLPDIASSTPLSAAALSGNIQAYIRYSFDPNATLDTLVHIPTNNDISYSQLANVFWVYIESSFNYTPIVSQNLTSQGVLGKVSSANYTIDMSSGVLPLKQFFLWIEDAFNPNSITKIGDIDFNFMGILSDLNSQILQSSVLIEFGTNFSNNQVIINFYNADTGAFVKSYTNTISPLQTGEFPQGYLRYKYNNKPLVTTPPMINGNLLGSGYYVYIISPFGTPSANGSPANPSGNGSQVNPSAVEKALKLIKAVANR